MKAKALGCALLLFPLLFAARMNAGTIQLDSLGTAADAGQYNSNGNTIAIPPNSLWAAALPSSSWVSFGKTGATSTPGFFVVPNGTVVSFFDVFNLSGIPSGGKITVMATHIRFAPILASDAEHLPLSIYRLRHCTKGAIHWISK
jgi:hypothetical protein